MERVVLRKLSGLMFAPSAIVQASSSEKPDPPSPKELIPADLAAFVLFLQPAHERLEIIHHRARGDVFAGRFLQNFAPILRAAFFQNVIQPRADFLVVGVIT